MIYIRFVGSITAKESTRKKALSEIRKIEMKETDKGYLVIGTSANGNGLKMLRQQEVLKKSDQNGRIWIVEESDKTTFFNWADENESIILSEVEVKDESLELGNSEQKKMDIHNCLPQTQMWASASERAQAQAQLRNSLAIKAVPNFDDYPYTKYEKARIIEARALQISAGSPIFVDPNGIVDSIEIAEMEFDAGVCPITVKRKTTPALDAKIRKREKFIKDLIWDQKKVKKSTTPLAYKDKVKNKGS